MEHEKRKIEFLAGLDTLNAKIATYAPIEPFAKNVKMSVIFTYGGGGDKPSPSTQGYAIYALAGVVSSLLVSEGYIKDEKQITKMAIEKRESSTPGISFFMQEVE
jgi:hypothetical protein